MGSAAPASSDQLQSFLVADHTYKTGKKDSTYYSIGVSVLTPKHLGPGYYPVIVRWHGGFLVTGSRAYSKWLHPWLLDYANAKSAIIVSPDYRLLPESNGRDILEDISAFWNWFAKVLPRLSSLVSAGIVPDISNVLIFGESAGAYVAAQSILTRPDITVRAFISQYGILNPRSPWYMEAFEKTIVGAATVDSDLVDRHLKEVRKGRSPSIVTAATPPKRMALALCMVQHGRYVEMLGNSDELFPMNNLDSHKARGGSLPAIWAYHGVRDTAVPVQDSILFVAKAKTVFPEAPIMLSLQDGEHGFDAEATLESPWLREGISFVDQFWPKRAKF